MHKLLAIMILETFNIDQAVEAMGFGRFQIKILFFTGFASVFILNYNHILELKIWAKNKFNLMSSIEYD